MILGSLINHPELLSRDTLYELRGIVAKYPYFETARLLMLNNLYILHDPNFGSELRRSIFFVNNRRALSHLIVGFTDRITEQEQTITESPAADRTISLIDAFLGSSPEEDEKLSFIPEAIVDYATSFLQEKEPLRSSTPIDNDQYADISNTDSVERALDLLSQPKDTIDNAHPALFEKENLDSAEQLEEHYFTETLAKIYIKQRKYSRALEIIQSLYLQFPQKNTYFADQIRFLEKLIINNNLK